MGQPEKNIRDVFNVLKGVEYPGHNFAVGPMEDGFYIQITYREADVEADCRRCAGAGEIEMLDGGMMPRPSGIPLPKAPCPDCEGTGKDPTLAEQRGRKWYVSRFATDSEIVQTCLVAALWSAEHRVREHFTYCPETANEPRAIYGPHFDANALWLMAGDPKATDARIPPGWPGVGD